jgi:hypothetical protein
MTVTEQRVIDETLTSLGQIHELIDGVDLPLEWLARDMEDITLRHALSYIVTKLQRAQGAIADAIDDLSAYESGIG